MMLLGDALMRDGLLHMAYMATPSTYSHTCYAICRAHNLKHVMTSYLVVVT